MGLETVIISSLKGVSKVLLIATGGAILSWRGILDLPMARGLSKLTYNYTFPCLIFMSILSVVNPESLYVIGVLLACAVCHLLFLMSIGFLLRRFARVPDHFKNGVVLATTFGNVGDMVLAMVMGVGGGEPFAPGAVTQGIAYVMVYAMVFTVFQFTLGDMMVAQEMKRNAEYKRLEDGEGGEGETTGKAAEESRLGNGEGDLNYGADADQDEDGPDDTAVIEMEAGSDGEADTTQLSPGSGNREKMKKLHKFTSVDAMVRANEPAAKASSKPTKLRALWRRLGCPTITLSPRLARVLSFLSILVTPPNITIVISAVVALIPPLRHLFYNPGGSPPPLLFMSETLQMVGAATVPLGITNVGGALAKINLRESKVPLRVNLLICFVKLFVMPVVGVSLIYLLTYHAGVLPADDKMLTFVLMVQCCVPTAQFLVSLYQIHGGDGTEVAGVMLIQYLLTIVTMSVYVTIILYLLQ